MERSPTPESLSRRLVQVTDRLQASVDLMSLCEETLMVARERLLAARLQLDMSRGVPEPTVIGDPTKATDLP